METVNCIRCDFRHKDNGNCTAVGGFCTAVPAAHCHLLRKYLNTGLTPKEAKRMSNILMDVGIDYNCSWEYVKNWLLDDRLRELAEADKDGRVVVLPCKAGDELWTFYNYPDEQVYSFTVTDISTLNRRTMLNTSRCGVIDARDVGKTVFLTREEAVEALEAMKNE